jgi:hypothetical protein
MGFNSVFKGLSAIKYTRYHFQRYVLRGKKCPPKGVDFFCYEILKVTSDPGERPVNSPTLTQKSVSSAGKI